IVRAVNVPSERRLAVTATRWPTLNAPYFPGARTVLTAPGEAVTSALRFASFATTMPLKLAAPAVPLRMAATTANATNARNLFIGSFSSLDPAGPLARTGLPLRHALYRQRRPRPL